MSLLDDPILEGGVFQTDGAASLRKRPPTNRPKPRQKERQNSWQQSYVIIIGGSCHKYHFCRDKSFVMWQNFCAVCRRKTFVATNICRNKKNFVATNICHNKQFCRDKTTSILLSRQIRALSQQKCALYFWQLPPVIAYFCREKKYKVSLSRQNNVYPDKSVARSILLSRQKNLSR